MARPPQASPSAVVPLGQQQEDAPVVRVLCVDGDPDIARDLLLRLSPEGIEVTVCTDGAEALLKAGMMRPDLVLVSSTVPGLPARRVVEVLRATLDIPVIVGINADDASAGMDALAAHPTACVPHPYDVDMLTPLLRSSRPAQVPWQAQPELLRLGQLTLSTASHQAWLADQPLALPRREFQVLRHLLHNAGRVVQRSDLQREIWHSDTELTNNTITVHIRRLRRRLDAGPTPRCVIRTVRGVGYRLELDQAANQPNHRARRRSLAE